MKATGRLAIAIVFATLALAHSGQPAFGSSFAVDSTADAVDASPGDGICADADGKCTLRAAVMETNALPGPDEITLPAGTYELTIPPTSVLFDGYDPASGDLGVMSDVVIRGAGSASTILDGGGRSRVIFLSRPLDPLAARIEVRIAGVTIQNGRSESGSAGIYSQQKLTLTDVVVSANNGGGILNQTGDLTVVASTVSDNTDGGIESGSGGTLTVIDSTISGNTAYLGAGLSASGTVTIVDSTVHGNSAGYGGGAEFVAADVSITNSTFANNTADCFGGGIMAQSLGIEDGVYLPSRVRLTNVSLVGNTTNCAGQGGNISVLQNSTAELQNTLLVDGGTAADCSDPVVSLGHNVDGDGSCGLSAEGDFSRGNVLTAELADNGGPTETIALKPGGCPSDACLRPNDPVDNGDPAACPGTDQRGLPRPFDGDGDGVAKCDIGAYEMQVGPWTCAPPCGALSVTPTPASLPPAGGSPSEGGPALPAPAIAIVGGGVLGIAIALFRRRGGGVAG